MANSTMLPQMPSLDAEEQAFQQEVRDIQQWWSDSRWRYTKRPFTADQIATKRGNLKIQYPGNAQSKKLWRTVEGRFKVRGRNPRLSHAGPTKKANVDVTDNPTEQGR